MVRNSKINGDGKIFAAERQKLFESSDLRNSLLNFRDESSNNKKLSSNEIKSLSFSNKNLNSTAASSNNSNNFLKFKEPICPENSKISNFSRNLNQKNSYKHAKSSHFEKSKARLNRFPSKNSNVRNFADILKIDNLLEQENSRKLSKKRASNSFFDMPIEKKKNLMMTNQNNIHSIYYKNNRSIFL